MESLNLQVKNKEESGVFGQLVSNLAPKIPKASSKKTEKVSMKTRSQPREDTAEELIQKAGQEKEKDPMEGDEFVAMHEGLPAQERKCMFYFRFHL